MRYEILAAGLRVQIYSHTFVNLTVKYRKLNDFQADQKKTEVTYFYFSTSKFMYQMVHVLVGVRGGGATAPPNLERTRFRQIAQVELGKINF